MVMLRMHSGLVVTVLCADGVRHVVDALVSRGGVVVLPEPPRAGDRVVLDAGASPIAELIRDRIAMQATFDYPYNTGLDRRRSKADRKRNRGSRWA